MSTVAGSGGLLASTSSNGSASELFQSVLPEAAGGASIARSHHEAGDLGGDLAAAHEGEPGEDSSPTGMGTLPPSPELRRGTTTSAADPRPVPSTGGQPRPPARLIDDPAREMNRSYLDVDRAPTSQLKPPDASDGEESDGFYNDREAWQRQQQERQQQRERQQAATHAASQPQPQASDWASRSIAEAQRSATRAGTAAFSYTARGVREGYRMHQRGEITIELVCTGVATLVFLWVLFWVFRHLHWTLQWLVMAAIIIWTLRLAGYAIDVESYCLEPLHQEFPALAQAILRAKDRMGAQMSSHGVDVFTGAGSERRRGSMGGEFSATGQFYEEGEEDAPLLARSEGDTATLPAQGEQVVPASSAHAVDSDYADDPELALRELERLRAENAQFRAAAASAAMPASHEHL